MASAAAMLECPFPGCGYSEVLLHDHIRSAHPGATVTFSKETTVTLEDPTAYQYQVLLHEPDVERVYVLYCWRPRLFGPYRALTLLCVGPPPPPDEANSRYSVMIGPVGCSLKTGMSGPFRDDMCTRRWPGPGPYDQLLHEKPCYLSVPDGYWSVSGKVSVTVKLMSLTEEEEEDEDDDDM